MDESSHTAHQGSCALFYRCLVLLIFVFVRLMHVMERKVFERWILMGVRLPGRDESPYFTLEHISRLTDFLRLQFTVFFWHIIILLSQVDKPASPSTMCVHHSHHCDIIARRKNRFSFDAHRSARKLEDSQDPIESIQIDVHWKFTTQQRIKQRTERERRERRIMWVTKYYATWVSTIDDHVLVSVSVCRSRPFINPLRQAVRSSSAREPHHIIILFAQF